MKTQSIASLLVGAAAGVAAMYLLDPEQGERRRRLLASKANEYWDDASEALGHQWHNVADYAKDAGQHAYAAAQGYANEFMGHARGAAGDVQSHADDARAHAVRQAQSWIEQGRQYLKKYGDQAAAYGNKAVSNVPGPSDVQSMLQNYGHAAWDQARKIGSTAHDRAVDALNRGRRAVAPRQSTSVVPVALTAMSFCLVGAGVMYVVDPQKGRARRTWIYDKVSSFVRRSGKTAYGKGKHFANRAYGAAAEARGSANELIDRVHDAIRGVLQDPKVVNVMADVNGQITIAGKVMADQIDRLLAAIHNVPGVREVINRVEAITNSTKSSPQEVH